MTNLASALFAFQKEAPSLHKNATNKHFGNSYLSLDALMDQITPVLHNHGLLLIQTVTTVGHDPQPALTTKLIHVESGEVLQDTMLLVLGKSDPQGQGSAITYARRYSLMALLGLVADEDDDGNSAARPQSAASPARSTDTPPSMDGDAPF